MAIMISGASSPHYASRRRKNGITMTLAYLATGFGLSWLALILGVLFWEGFSGLSLRVFTEMTPPPGAAGGLLNPIMGSLVMTVIAVVIGNAHRISGSILAPGTTISATIANEFTEAVGDLYTSSLIALGLILFVITFIVLAFARLMLMRLEARLGK